MYFVQKTGEVGTDETGTTKNKIRHILQFQIIQTDYEKFDVYMVVDDEEDIPEVQMLFKKLCDKDQIRGEFTFSFVDYLYPSEKTGIFAQEDYN